jgi:hypothetical protein
MRGLLLVIGLSGCIGGMHDPSTVEQQNGACFALEGRTFASVQQLECGRDGNRCHWTLSFATRDPEASDFAWAYSDVNESGQVECRGQSIVATRASRTLTGTYDPGTQMLTWNGELYSATPQ